MKKSILVLAWLFSSFGVLAPSLKSQEGTAAKQPVAPVRPVTDDYYGTKIVDNYRYMENLKDPEVQAWMKGQNDYTRAVLANIPGRAKLLARIKQVDQSVPVVGGQRLPGDLYLIRKRLANGDVYKLYLRHGLDGKDQILVDPTKVKLGAPNQAKGTNAILDGSLSNDNRYIAVDIAPGGSERDAELHAFEVSSGRETGDVILHAQGGVSWLPDNRSFVYNRLQKLPPGAPVTEIEQKVRAYLHVLGSAMSAWHETRRSCVVSAGRERSLSFECIVLPPEFCFTAILVLRKLGTRSAFWEEKTQVRHIPGRR